MNNCALYWVSSGNPKTVVPQPLRDATLALDGRPGRQIEIDIPFIAFFDEAQKVLSRTDQKLEMTRVFLLVDRDLGTVNFAAEFV